MKLGNMKPLNAKQINKLRGAFSWKVESGESVYILLPENPQGGKEVDVITQGGMVL